MGKAPDMGMLLYRLGQRHGAGFEAFWLWLCRMGHIHLQVDKRWRHVL